MIKVIDTEIKQVKIIQPEIFSDQRGYFFESFNEIEFKKKICNINFVQDNQSYSKKGTMKYKTRL